MTEHLTAEGFKTKVFDYQKNKDWKFEGDLPCLIDFLQIGVVHARWLHPSWKSFLTSMRGS